VVKVCAANVVDALVVKLSHARRGRNPRAAILGRICWLVRVTSVLAKAPVIGVVLLGVVMVMLAPRLLVETVDGNTSFVCEPFVLELRGASRRLLPGAASTFWLLGCFSFSFSFSPAFWLLGCFSFSFSFSTAFWLPWSLWDDWIWSLWLLRSCHTATAAARAGKFAICMAPSTKVTLKMLCSIAIGCVVAILAGHVAFKRRPGCLLEVRYVAHQSRHDWPFFFVGDDEVKAEAVPGTRSCA
jgi:hypothetical protein